MRKIRITIIVLIWLIPIVFLCYLCFLPKYGSEELKDGLYTIKNNSLVWELRITNEVICSYRIRNTKTKESLDLCGEDFSIRLGPKKDLGWIGMDTERIFTSKTGKTITPEECQPLDIVRGKNKTSLLFYYEPFQIILNLEFTHDSKENFIRRSLSLTSCYDKELVVEEVALGDWSIDDVVSGGGDGLPAFVNDKWFLSGEEPWFETKVTSNHILLTHHPSAYLSKGSSWTSDSTIIGGGTEYAKDILKDYIQSVMLSPKFFSLYNTWYDLRDDTLTSSNIITNFIALQNKLNQFGAGLDYCVIDDGWFDKETLYTANSNTFPNGLNEVSNAIISRNSKLGLWLPFSGLYLDNKSLGQKYHFEEANSKYFCLSGTNYFSALSRRIIDVIQNDHIAFFKHDFNYFNCTMAKHRHLRNLSHSHEANMRQTAKLLDMERETTSNVIQALTTGINLSPWWLKYAHILWMGGGDISFNWEFPFTSRAEAEMTYRDGMLYELLREKRTFFPLYALMTHGIIDGKLNSVGPWLNDDQWANYIMNYMGRGTAIRELYIYAPKLSESRSMILAKALLWAEIHNDQMLNSEMILGDPRKNEVYAFRGHDKKGNCYVSIRNPKFSDEEISLQDIGLNSKYYKIAYPYQMIFKSDSSPKLKIPAESVVIIESLCKVRQSEISGKEEIKKVNISQLNIKENVFTFDVNVPDNAIVDLVITCDKNLDLKLADNNASITKLKRLSFKEAKWRVDIVNLSSGNHKITGSSSDVLTSEDILKLQIRAKYQFLRETYDIK